ncbi:hypothetical protein AWZ03_006272 [Drosophila navojoa]|uniref:Uncharacterized protein n=1 Tax=Drosophila navojoa TaxID=7232 RepID=A0A484BEX0_DRONA|nr:hypothetical protein AWZ03_006272 [Drosophila navojoa]
MIHKPKPKPKPLLRQHSQSHYQPQGQPPAQPQIQHPSQSLTQSHQTHPSQRSFLARQRSGGQWLSSPSFSLSQASISQPRPSEHFPLRHQPLSYPQARPHSQSQYQHPHSYTSSRTQSHTSLPTRSQLYPSDTFQSTSFSHPPCSDSDAHRNRNRNRPKSSAAEYDWRSSSFSQIDAVTHAIRNKIIVEEDEEDILTPDRFY